MYTRTTMYNKLPSLQANSVLPKTKADRDGNAVLRTIDNIYQQAYGCGLQTQWQHTNTSFANFKQWTASALGSTLSMLGSLHGRIWWAWDSSVVYIGIGVWTGLPCHVRCGLENRVATHTAGNGYRGETDIWSIDCHSRFLQMARQPNRRNGWRFSSYCSYDKASSF